jgi:hypothetical protein
MKKFYLLYVLSTVFTLSCIAQVTISMGNFPRQATFSDTVYNAANAPTLSVPTHGANQNWDYSSIMMYNMSVSQFSDASTDPNFTNAYSKQSLDLFVFGFPISGYRYERFSITDWGLMGVHTERARFTLAPSAAPTDSILFLENTDLYGGSTSSIVFPVTYQTTWSGTRHETTPFELSVASFGLVNASCEMQSSVTDSREVVGYGNLTIPDENGTPVTLSNVLLFSSTVTVTDSFFLMGAPAPAALLNAFGLTQGSVFVSTAYLFYMPDFGAPILRLAVSSNNVLNVGIRPSAAKTSSVSTNDFGFEQNISAYPVPAKSGQSMTLSFEEPKKNLSLRITDMLGRTIYQEQIAVANKIHSLILPETAPGAYVLRISSNGQLLSQSKLLID